MNDFTPPEQRTGWIGDPALEARLRQYIDAGTLTHGWMLVGPRGVGKATLAYRVARCVLGHCEFTADESLSVSDTSKTASLIAAGAHPDLFVASRIWDEKKERFAGEITVDTVRKLTTFLHRTPSLSKWRVVIIDAADDLNKNAANALLKVLEEPPAQALILLVCHSPGKLLPTIRSRCRRIDVRPLSDEQVRDFLIAEGFVEDAGDIAKAAQGRPGYALELAASDGGEALTALADLLQASRRKKNPSEAIQLLTGKAGDRRWTMFKSLLVEIVSNAARAKCAGEFVDPALQDAGAEGLVEAWEELNGFVERADNLNLDRTQIIIHCSHIIARAFSARAA